MNANQIVLGSLLALAVIVAAVSGYRYIEREKTAERLIGTWVQEDPLATLQAGVGEDEDDASPEDLLYSPDDASEPDSQPLQVQMPGLQEGLVKALSLRTAMTFEEDGRMIVSTGDKDSEGRWVLSQANGKKKTVVARVMQTPTFEQRLVIHFSFDGKDRIIVSDEAGVEGAFRREKD